MFKKMITKVFGTHSERELKAIEPIIKKIESYEDEFRALPDEALKAKRPQFRERSQTRETMATF
jgi:preprotein translocase subunit SecA